MTTIITAVNQAIITAGAELLSDGALDAPGAGDETARLVNALWPLQRDAVLRAHPWNCADTYRLVATDGDAPEWGFVYAIPWPSEPYCLRVLALSAGDEAVTHRVVRGRRIYTNTKGPLQLRYVARVENPALMDPLLVEAIGARIAARLIYRKASNRGLKNEAWDLYREILAEARAVDGQEGTPEDDFADLFLEAWN